MIGIVSDLPGLLNQIQMKRNVQLMTSSGNRSWDKQRKFALKSKHRKAINQRSLPAPSFLTKGRTYWSKTSLLGYLMAKGIYWNYRYHEPVVIESPEFSLQGLAQ